MDNFEWAFNSSPWAGVWVFFVLSGYLMGKVFFTGKYQLDSSGIFRFYKNRLYRIVPVYVFVIVIVGLLVHPDLFLGKNISTMIDLLIFDSKSNTPGNPIGATWSINTEMKFYLCAPILSYFMFKIHSKFRWLVIGLVVLLGVAIRMGTINYFGMGANWYTYTYTPTITNIDLFLIGILANVFVSKNTEASKISYYVGIGLLVIFYFFITYFGSFAMVAQPVPPFKPFYYFVILGPTVTAMTTFIVIILFERYKFKEANFIQKKIMSLGMITYCLYVIHEPILESLKVNFGIIKTLQQSVAISGFTYLLLLILANFVYQYIEKPFDAKKKISKQ